MKNSVCFPSKYGGGKMIATEYPSFPLRRKLRHISKIMLYITFIYLKQGSCVMLGHQENVLAHWMDFTIDWHLKIRSIGRIFLVGVPSFDVYILMFWTIISWTPLNFSILTIYYRLCGNNHGGIKSWGLWLIKLAIILTAEDYYFLEKQRNNWCAISCFW